MESPSLPPAPPAALLLSAADIAFELHRHEAIRTAEDIRTRTAFTEQERASSVKTMAFVTVPRGMVLAAVPGLARIRYGPLASALGVHRSVLKPADEEVLRQLDMEPGGVSPLCADPGVTVVFDSAVPLMGRVLCGSGWAQYTVEAESADIVRLAPNALIADIAVP
ncbi:YbaK/EbsC family protein [Streptomyces sp. NPDC005303]|uniref:aminoacyl-tRNA deacylase n=1 Tax=Streptomyces sp. NPDC005303 TaxID=3155713 RepID=UPI0033B39D4F